MVKSRPSARSHRAFYIGLAAIAVLGIGVIAFVATRPRADAVTVTDPSAPLPAATGYLLGDSAAPVQVLEFADFECPACADFAVITGPDVRKRLVETGIASYRFFDFPLPQHRNSWNASLAAACAAEQNRFWPMHDLIFQHQFGPQGWAGKRNPKGQFEDLARQIGLNVEQWEQCYDSRKYQQQIAANRAEGLRRQIQSTPTFVIGRRMIAGSIPYDRFAAYVDSARAESAPTASDTATARP